MAITGTVSLKNAGEFLGKRLDLVAREVSQDIAETIIVGGPHGPGTKVDTGFLRASWITSIGTPDYSGEPQAPEGTPKDVRSFQDPEFSLALLNMKAGDVAYLTNNADYARVVEWGSMHVPPTFMVSWPITNAQAITDEAVARIREAGL